MRKTRQISNILALIVTVIINYLSNTGIFNGNTMASVSAQYQNLFTPAGYAFAIWGLIYISLFAFVIYQGKGLFSASEPDPDIDKVGWLFVISCAANCLWVVTWLYEYTGLSVIIMGVLLITLLRIVLNLNMEMSLVSIKKVAFLWWPFALYTGWIILAQVANVAAYLTKIDWPGFGLSDVAWTLIMVTVATIVYLYLTWTRNLRESAMVGVWGLVAVAVANWEGEKNIAYFAIVAAIVLLISNGVHGFRNRGRYFLMQ